MAKIFLDANIFIDFYQSATDRLKVFDELIGFSKHFVITDQTISEVERNRANVLRRVREQFSSCLKLTPYTTTILRELDSHKKVLAIRDNFVDMAKAVLNDIDSLIEDESSDPVAAKIKILIGSNGVLNLTTTEKLIASAQTRKSIGMPPTSPDKFTIGDELTWEILLAGCSDDLVIVSRDQTYSNNVSLLKKEYKTKTGFELLLVTDRPSEALKLVGETPSKNLVNEEDAYETGLCPDCGVELGEMGYEGSDGDSFGWLFCPRCHRDFYPPVEAK